MAEPLRRGTRGGRAQPLGRELAGAHGRGWQALLRRPGPATGARQDGAEPVRRNRATSRDWDFFLETGVRENKQESAKVVFDEEGAQQLDDG